jgi:hypothetical protein
VQHLDLTLILGHSDAGTHGERQATGGRQYHSLHLHDVT